MTLTREQLVSGFDGFGAQYNQNVYAERSKSVGVTEENVRVMEERVGRLAPQLSRVFFDADALKDPDLLLSFRKTVDLAQQTAGAVNITLQGLGPRVLRDHPQLITEFAQEIVGLLDGAHPISKLKWVTLRNEPNGSAPIRKDLYARCYREFDAELRRLGAGSRVGLMGGDLLQNSQGEWFSFLADDADLRRILRAYSIHVYWQFDDPAKIDKRLRDVSEIRARLPAVVKNRPFYVMECEPCNKDTTASPKIPASSPTADASARRTSTPSSVSGSHSRRRVAASPASSRGTPISRSTTATASCITRSSAVPYRINPLAAAARLPRASTAGARRRARLERSQRVGRNRHTTGRRVRAPDRPVEDQHHRLDKDGSALDTKTTSKSTYTISGVPPNTRFQLCLWNKFGNGQTSFSDQATSNSAKTVTISVPQHCAFVLTTRRIQ